MSATNDRGNSSPRGTPAGWVEPELATLTHDRFSGPDWLYERKFDGERCGALPKTSVHWVEPKLVGQVAFTEWTGAGQLRHPRYLGLRRDKDPASVTREVARP